MDEEKGLVGPELEDRIEWAAKVVRNVFHIATPSGGRRLTCRGSGPGPEGFALWAERFVVSVKFQKQALAGIKHWWKPGTHLQ